MYTAIFCNIYTAIFDLVLVYFLVIYIYMLYIYVKTWPSSLFYIQQRRIQNPFQRLSKEVISLEVTILTKKSILDVFS